MSGMAKRFRRKALVAYARELRQKSKAGEKATVRRWAWEVKVALGTAAGSDVEPPRAMLPDAHDTPPEVTR